MGSIITAPTANNLSEFFKLWKLRLDMLYNTFRYPSYLIHKTVPWKFYTVRTLAVISKLRSISTSLVPLNFYMNLAKMQPHFTFLHDGWRPATSYTLGYILRLYIVVQKRARRETKRTALAFTFFTKYHTKMFASYDTTMVVYGYRRRYNLILSTAFPEFAQQHASSIMFLPQTLSGLFKFRRVKGIKRRIRKRINAQ